MGICEKYGITDAVLLRYEQAAAETYDESFVSAAHIAALAQEGGLVPENRRALAGFMAAADDSLRRFLWLFYYFQFKTDEDFSPNIWALLRVATPAAVERAYPGMIRATVYLLSAENLREWVAARGLDESVFLAYFTRYNYLADLNFISYKTYGLIKLAPFLYGYAKPFMLTLGRLSYQVIPYRDYCEAYLGADGRPVFLALPNYTYNTDGLQDKTADFRPELRREADRVTGYRFDARGRLEKEPVTLSLSDYRLYLKPGDTVLTIHIPGTGKLSPSLVDESLAQAAEVFGRYFPAVRAFVCQTWFLDPGLRDVLKPGSNLRAFADRFDVISASDNENHSLYEHIFVTSHDVPLAQLQPKNDFQRTMLARALRGEKIYWGYGLLKGNGWNAGGAF